MNISNLSNNNILFLNNVEEESNFIAFSDDEIFISKTRNREIDFSGNMIANNEDKICTKSIWIVNYKANVKKEVIPYGEFDVQDVYLTENYLYYVKVVDSDSDGLLLEKDYLSGEVWRLNRSTLDNSFCFKIDPFYFHRFLSANDSYVVFVSEDRIPDVTEIVFYNLTTNKCAVLKNIYEKNWYDFRLISNHEAEPDYFIYKEIIDDTSEKKISNVQMLKWSDLITQLQWE